MKEMNWFEKLGSKLGVYRWCGTCRKMLWFHSRRRLEDKQLRDKYNELVFAVASKHTNETRHETALRYIQEGERRVVDPHEAYHPRGEWGVIHKAEGQAIRNAEENER